MTTAPAASVLEAPPPRFSPEEAADIAADLFGVAGTATPLGSERDQTFLIDDGGDGAVLKVSNLGEHGNVLDLETDAILHVTRVDPELPLSRPRAARAGGYRATVKSPDGAHFARLFDRMRGRDGGPELGDGALFAYGATHARLNLALRGFFHPAAGRELLWDAKQTPKLRPLLPSIEDERRRGLVSRAIDRFEERVAPRWPLLRAQVVHGDLNLDNVVLDERDWIAGIFDFGDVTHTAEIADFAVGLASLLRGRPEEDVFRAARLAIDGYASHRPLEPLELELVGSLVTARLATIVTISAWRTARYPENAEYIQAWDADSWQLLEHFNDIGADTVARELGAPRPPQPTAELAQRRRHALGSALAPLTYRAPVHVIRGEGVWLYDAAGRRLLDAYNNVPVVGHCHPRVTEAVVRQTRLVNTHARYLYEPLVELAERLADTMPPESGLDTVMLVNSGSEANDLAWRLATGATGNGGGIATSHAYHGVSTAISEFSPEEWPAAHASPTTELVAPPAPGADVTAEMERATSALAARGLALAATFVDGGFTSDGIHVPAPEAVQAIVRATHEAGGLYVADEVQAGHGRTGGQLWSFAGYGIEPDLVTLGKPMGNGYPVAAVITRAEIVDDFAERMHFFSTFGGNPVAATAALAVLEVIADERIVENAQRVGTYLRDRLRALGLEVRGQGLLIGVQMSDPDRAGAVVDALREDGVLIGRTGPRNDVLKIRPPLVFGEEHADLVVEALGTAT